MKKSTRTFSSSLALLYFALSFALNAGTALAAPVTLKVTSGTVQFLAVGKPSAIKIRGKGTALTGTIQVADTNVTGDLTFALNSFDTGIELRDHHMKEKYLETGKFPTATLQLTKLTLPMGWASSDTLSADAAFAGTLTLHGVSKLIQGTASIKKTSAGAATAHAEFDIAISDFSIDIPSYLGIKVADQVHVTVDAAGASSNPSGGTTK